MRIGIDARTLLSEHYTGIARSVYENICAWMRLYPEHEFYLLSSKKLYLPVQLPDNWHIIDSPWLIDKGKLWTLFKLPRLIKELKLDVFWGTNYTLPRRVDAKTKYVVTIYDLALFKFDGIGAKKNTIRVKLFSKSACKKADKVIAISEATAEDIVDIMGINRNKIVVSYCGGLPTGFKKLEYKVDNEINAQLQISEKFFLFISTFEPRKNIITIVKAFERFVDETGSEMKLVLAGRKGWNCDDIYTTINESKYCDRIILPGFISDHDKAFLLNNATAFVYPSIYEGFGIPILEAFAYDLPVITTNVSSMPEVAGDAAFYMDDPKNVDQLAELLGKVVNLNASEKDELVNKMQKQLALFSWEKNANEIMKIFTEIL